MLSIIVAIAKNNVIGINNQMPWHIPEDFAHFKKTTMGHTIVMGEKTFASISRPLPGRKNVVITLVPDFRAEGVDVIHSLDELLAMSRGDEEIFVIGGATIYKLVLPHVDRLYLTLVDQDFTGDAFFPKIDFENAFTVTSTTAAAYSGANQIPYRFVTAERKRKHENTKTRGTKGRMKN